MDPSVLSFPQTPRPAHAALAAHNAPTPRALGAPSTPATARGEATYEAIVRGEVRNYCLALRAVPADFDGAVAALVARVHAVVGEAERTRPVTRFTVGKTSVARAASAPRNAFDVTNRKHLDVKHVTDRWRKLYDPAGYDGLVALTLVTPASTPAQFLALGFGPQDYALALEQGVIHQFALRDFDGRLGNVGLASGKQEQSGAPGYLVYVAFEFEKPQDLDMGGLKRELKALVEVDDAHMAKDENEPPTAAASRAGFTYVDSSDEE